MKRIWDRLYPHTLKNRLLLAIVTLVIVPFCGLSVYLFSGIEASVKDKTSQQSHAQLLRLQQSLGELTTIVFKTVLLLEKDPTIVNVLTEPERYNPLERKNKIESTIGNIDSSLFLYNSPFVFYTLADKSGNLYTSFQPDRVLDYDRFMQEYGSVEPDLPYRWITHDRDDLFHTSGDSRSSHLLTLIARFRNARGDEFGIARVSMDFSYWFQTKTRERELEQQYFILDGKGKFLTSPIGLPSEVIGRILNSAGGSGYFSDDRTGTLVQYSRIPQFGWVLGTTIPERVLFDDIHKLKKRFFLIFSLCMLFFTAIIYAIALTVTRPLRRLQTRMARAVNHNLKIHIPTEAYKGEILELTLTFNQMIADMNDMIGKLTAEQRQKEAVRFQMLLSQMNPHFLLNTLNVVKGIAMRDRNEAIAGICMSLGQLLETSLNSEVELIRLSEELELVQAYIHIQQFRHKRTFTVQVESDAELNHALVPKLSLQPLVENAIFHGLSVMEEDGILAIRLRTEQGKLVMEVEDNGIGMEASGKNAAPRKRPPIGTQNLRERLELLFRKEASLAFIPLSRGTLVRMTIPLLISEPYAKGSDVHVVGFRR